MKTFTMTEGKNKKGDVTVSAADMQGALASLKAQVGPRQVETTNMRLHVAEFSTTTRETVRTVALLLRLRFLPVLPQPVAMQVQVPECARGNIQVSLLLRI